MRCAEAPTAWTLKAQHSSVIFRATLNAGRRVERSSSNPKVTAGFMCR